jgi:hypothetical protein
MTLVFIGGSRTVSRLNPLIREKLDDLMKRGCRILIGDANGADKAVQEHYASLGYRNVIVYCMDRCRNNVGGWESKVLPGAGEKRGFAYYAVKDLAMAQDAECGVMLWDGVSRGTLNNIENLMSGGKKTLVYYAPEQSFAKLRNRADMAELLRRCDAGKLRTARRRTQRATAAPGGQLVLTSEG